MDDILQVILDETEKVFKPLLTAPFDDENENENENEEEMNADILESSNQLENEIQKEALRKLSFFESQNGDLPSSIRCKHCPQKFAKRTDLDSHLQKRHQDQRPFTCEQCEKRFATKNILKQHVRIHTKEKPYSCHFCYKCFSHRTALANHIRTHTGEKPFDCSFCSKSFGEKAKLLLHMRVHTGEKPFRCAHCQRAFRDKSSYNVHLRIHTGEKPFCCHYCQRCFTHRNSFKDHLRIHTGEKPFVCAHCKRDFAKQSTLRKHLEVHGVAKPLELHLHAIIKPSQQLEAGRSDLASDQGLVTSSCVKDSPEEGLNVTSFVGSEQKRGRDFGARVNSLLGALHENRIHVCVFCRTLCEDSDGLERHLRSHSTEGRIWKIGCDLVCLFTAILGLDVVTALGFNRRDFQRVIEDFGDVLEINEKSSGNDANDPILVVRDKLRSFFTALVPETEVEEVKLDRVDIFELLYDMVVVYPFCDNAK